MDREKALQIELALKGQSVGGWTVQRYLDNGKSAAVFEAVGPGGRAAAVKIFDDELIARYGDKTQLARIQRELDLVGHH